MQWNRREHTVRTIEYVVPTGANVGMVYADLSAAYEEWRSLRSPGDLVVGGMPDDWCTVHVEDHAVIFRMQFKSPPDKES